MIRDARGDLLRAEADALVNTVNCVGTMGKGIALQFKQAFPENDEAYRRACKAGEVRPGRMFVFPTGSMTPPRFIINFPTKRHWRGKSRIEDVESGLQALVVEIERLGIRSIAVPPLGCGNGGLDWADVRPRIIRTLEQLPDLDVLLYPPSGTPPAMAIPVGTKAPTMTPARALLVQLMNKYLGLAYRLTLLEVQKLAYFLQEAGEPLKLRYEAGTYGPYAANLNKVLERIEGHFTRGLGDSPKPDRDIELLPGAIEQAGAFLAERSESLDRLDRVGTLIEGFETPYGMELLATVHWVAQHHEAPATDPESAIASVHAWGPRKQRRFQPAHIRIAWQHLHETGWLNGDEGGAASS